MSKVVEISAKSRKPKGSHAAKRLRSQGQIPCVVYGHQEEVEHCSVDGTTFRRAFEMHHARMFTLKLDGKSETVLVKDLQWDYLGKDMIHVDFERHSLSEKVKVIVPIELKNQPKVTEGAALDQPTHEIHVECPAGQIPDSIVVDITNLTLGKPIHVSDLTVPPNATLLDNPEQVVVQLRLPGAQETEDLAATEGAEPELIGDKGDEASEGEEKE